MRVSAAAWSRVMPFFSRCARRISPSRDTVLRLPAVRRDAVDLAELSGPAVRAHDAALLHLVDEPASAREADGHLALQHRHGGFALGRDDLHGLLVAVVL